MRSPVVKLIIVVVALILLGSIGYTLLHVDSTRERYVAEAERHFSALVDEASLLYTRQHSNKNRIFSLFRKRLRDYPYLRSLILYDTDGRLHYAYGRSKTAIAFTTPHNGTLPREAVRQEERSHYDRSLTTSLAVEVGLPFAVTAHAVYEVMPREEIFPRMQFLLIVLTGTALILGTALALLPAPQSAAELSGQDEFYANGSGVPQVPNEYYRSPAEHPPQRGSSERNTFEAPAEDAGTETGDHLPRGFIRNADRSRFTDEAEAAAGAPAASSPASSATPSSAAPSAAGDPGAEEEGESGEGYFSSHTQLVRKPFFLPRLESELKRAASFDQDLSLLLFRCPQADTPERFYTLAEKAKAFFTFHDLIFELEESTIGVILPNTDLDEGIMQSSNFQKKLFEEGDTCTADVRLGLSSRNGRLVDGQRVYGEARAALHKARHDPDHPSIVGFRPDPSKYREYISRQSRA